MIDIYVDITDGVVSGNGTPTSPYNRPQFINVIGGSITSSYHFYIRGYYNSPVADEYFIPNIGSNNTQTYDIIISGWDIDINGSPIVKINSTHGYIYNIGDTVPNFTLTIQDFIFISPYSLFIEHERTNSTVRTYKNILFVSDELYNHEIISGSVAGKDSYFYGCTIQSTTTTLQQEDNIYLYDSVIISDDLVFSDGNKIITEYNITTVLDTNIVIDSGYDLSEYIPLVYKSNILPFPIISDFDGIVAYCTDNDRMYFENYNIPIFETALIQQFRNTHEYNHGLFNYDRRSVGAYSFSGEYIIPDNPLNEGHIGSFYFGGDYTNGDVSVDAVSLYLDPPDGLDIIDIAVDVDTNVAIISLEIPDNVAFGNKSFNFDFSAAPTSGGTPLCTEFHAYNLCPNGSFEGVVCPKELHWYPDIINTPGEYVVCAFDKNLYTDKGIQKFNHTYCGTYLQDYDVELCVIYEFSDCDVC